MNFSLQNDSLVHLRFDPQLSYPQILHIRVDRDILCLYLEFKKKCRQRSNKTNRNTKMTNRAFDFSRYDCHVHQDHHQPNLLRSQHIGIRKVVYQLSKIV